jgi:2-polyprenyl-6-methoxyphenol hydroxylase-like FAD-dependent oxidoreductase
MNAVPDTDVIIIGGGPTGLVLALELGLRAVRALLVDDKPDTAILPAANATQARTMEHFRRLGLADEIRAQGLPPDYPTDVTYWTRYTRHELARFELPASRDARAMVRNLSGSWSAAELPHRCSQMYIERILKARAQALPSVQLHFASRVEEFGDHGTHVSAQVRDLTTGQSRLVTARYLVGADGPRSLVRKQLGIAYGGEGGARRDFMGGQMHAIHVKAPGLYDFLGRERAWMYWAFNPERRAFMAAINGVDEFVFHTQLREEVGDEVSDAEAQHMFCQALGAEMDVRFLARLSWKAGFTLVADEFARGRVFMAGDAVHLFTPTGGLGYNTGVEDAVNLGWKLAAVLKGWAGTDLLATYEMERRPVALRNTAFARRFADSVGLFTPHPRIEDDSDEGATLRREAGDYLNRHSRAEFNIPGITFGARYDGSPAIIGDASTPPPDEANQYVSSACPGGRAPHAWLADGKSLYDHLGFDFTLLCLRGRGDTSGAFERAALARAIPLVTLAPGMDELREIYQADFALIRPDQVVAWRGNEGAVDPATVLDTVCRRLAPGH